MQFLHDWRNTHTSRWLWLHCQLVQGLFFDVLRLLRERINAQSFVKPVTVRSDEWIEMDEVKFVVWREVKKLHLQFGQWVAVCGHTPTL